ncbi:ficolin-2 [Exaiptasia diaphana]|uniref:Fibrinogen C-terminal domain-containing protein n=1 Tax=Exaiptasia diaphana TaxID=2652724 RepID=A0A913XTE5_EXADI|nr:ficolin-2 [Exaiptasia diaphana]
MVKKVATMHSSSAFTIVASLAMLLLCFGEFVRIEIVLKRQTNRLDEFEKLTTSTQRDRNTASIDDRHSSKYNQEFVNMKLMLYAQTSKIKKHEVRDGSLILKDFTTTDSGVYICSATSPGISHKESRSTIKVPFKDCSEIFQSGERRNGEYTVNPDNQGSFQVYCDMTTDGGGWTVFQRRKDGSVDFYLNWQQYKTGFGNLNGEFWLGNDYIHRLTARTPSSLRVEIGDWDGSWKYAKYGSFSVGAESDKYRLSFVGYSGSAGDSMTFNNRAFTTKDRDNDGDPGGNCAVQRTGAWWYGNCATSNLNGKYLGNVVKKGGLYWYHYKRNWQSFKTSEMKLRPQNHK